ncbi:hypothetical protein PQE71_gp133 [Bacillus phage Izhevsk]|uniref:Uncharacterized protein n=1 Tax=Bacillus phage Izhevsk TaxID=2724322 RepID=A0A6H0X677_9CAUD|nr:hypothetical protein PQE71_gp133 [Bacillus phage Izhevsk]QIW89815.1 hypothetical protein Izhevsk_134 [Bacillus phage Izhevsk]UUV46775.1 hypothetical protein [Bacillus phage vB_BanS-Thrax4]
MEKKQIVVANGAGLGAGHLDEIMKNGVDAEKFFSIKGFESTPIPEEFDKSEVQTLEEAIEEVARENGLTVEEVKEYLHKFQRDLYKKYTKKKVDKTKAKAKKKQAKKSKKRNR